MAPSVRNPTEIRNKTNAIVCLAARLPVRGHSMSLMLFALLLRKSLASNNANECFTMPKLPKVGRMADAPDLWLLRKTVFNKLKRSGKYIFFAI
jgi:hypothetical protein